MSYRGVKVLITGADGFIGSHLTEALVRDGARVTALAQYNSFDGFGWLDDLPSEIRAEINATRGDIRDGGQIDRLATGQEVIFHLAALIAIPFSYEAPRAFVDTNVHGVLNILEAARKHGCRRVIHTSTSEVYGTAQFTPITEAHPLQGQSPYSASKIGGDMLAESFARSFDTPVVLLRPFNTYGPRQSERAVISAVIRQALDPQCASIKLGDLTPRRDFTFVADTASAFMKLGAVPQAVNGVVYNAGSGRAVSIAQLVEVIRGITGCNKPVEAESRRIRPENSEVRELLASADRLRDLTGWSAATSLEAGLGHTIDWWTKRLKDGKVRSAASYIV